MLPWREKDHPENEQMTIWSIFPGNTRYFEPSPAPFMVNYIVDDLEALLDRLAKEGVHIDPKRQDESYGRFAWIYDPDGKAVNGFSHCYKRHGTTTLFAALEVATGQVKTAHCSRRRRREFLDFMNEIAAANPNRENPCRAEQLEHAQAERGLLAEAPSQRAAALYSHLFVLAESSRMLVQHPEPSGASWRQFHLAPAVATGD